MSSKARLVDVWLIVECPHCRAPQTINKCVVPGGKIVNLFGGHSYVCYACDQMYYLEIVQYEPLGMEREK